MLLSQENIQHVNKKIDPINDLETIKTEILLADMKSNREKTRKKSKKKLTDKQIKLLKDILDKLNKAETLDISNDPESKKIS